MSDVIVEIVVEVLTILAIATKEVKRGRFSELISCVFWRSLMTGYSETYFKKLAGEREMEDNLERLDKLTQEEARMASAEQLKMTHVVDDRVRIVEGRVQDVRGDVQDVCGDVQDVGDKVQNVDGKLEQANRSLSLQILNIVLWT